MAKLIFCACLHNEEILAISLEEVFSLSLSLPPGALEKSNHYMSVLCRRVADLGMWLVHLFIGLLMKVGWATWMK